MAPTDQKSTAQDTPGHPLCDRATGSPGPWKRGGRDGLTIYAPNGRLVAEVNRSWFVESPTEADARLIESAPDLLAACKAQHAALDTLLAMLIDRDRSFYPTKSPAWPAVEQGNAAIAKAEGGSNA